MLSAIQRCLYSEDASKFLDKICYSCQKKIILDETDRDNVYFYKIQGLGKRDNQFICHRCLLLKACQSKS